MNKGIILIWPKHNDFKNIMLEELNEKNYKIIEVNYIDVNKNYITNLLREIHYGKEWWRENLLKEVEKRLCTNETQRLIYLIVESENIHLNFKKFKKYVREKYNLDKSYFHLCDPDCKNHLGLNCNCPTDKEEFKFEYDKHIHYIKNKNAIHFLNNSIYKEDYNFYKYFNTYKIIVEYNVFNTDRFCIDNGGILAAYGIRDTHDLDYLTTTKMIFDKYNVGCENENHKVEYERLGYSIENIINDEENYFYHFNMKFMSIDILKNFKYNRTHTIGTGHKEIRQKDINDFNLMIETNYI